MIVILVMNCQHAKSADNCRIRLPDNINSYQPVLVPVLTLDGNELYFDRQQHPGNIGGHLDNDDIWFSIRLDIAKWSEPERLDTPINSKYSDVIFTIMPDGDNALGYGSYFSDSKTKQGFAMLKRKSGKWLFDMMIDIKNYYNLSKNFYGSLSADRNVLILSLEREDSRGNHDLYISLQDKGKQEWSEPLNLGDVINTSFNETAPHLAYDNKTLYFSSYRAGGIGKADLYMSRRLDDTWQNWSKPVNLGKFINTQYDENGIWLTALGDSAIIVSYDTSFKQSGLFYVCLPDDLQPEPYTIVRGRIFKQTDERYFPVLNNVTINIVCNNGEKDIYEIDNGNYAVVIANDCECDFEFNLFGFEKSKFKILSQNLKHSQIVNRDVTLVPGIKEPKLALILYFDSDIDTLSALEQSKLHLSLGELRNKEILLIGHTDERGTDNYNYNLSIRRATHVLRKLKDAGFKSELVNIEGRGKTQPVSSELEKNRRVEVYILN